MTDHLDDDTVFGLIAENRRQLVQMFSGLDEGQWNHTTLCPAWTVRQLAGHLILPFSYSTPRLMLGVIASGGSFDKFSVKASRRIAEQPTATIVEVLRANEDNRFTPPGLGPGAPLSDTAVHMRDAARPLGLATTPPPSTWRVVLDFLMTPAAKRAFVPRNRLPGLSFRATDQEWSAGSGDEVSGPSEALAMAMAGRSAALADLSGPGVAVLQGRLG